MFIMVARFPFPFKHNPTFRFILYGCLYICTYFYKEEVDCKFLLFNVRDYFDWVLGFVTSGGY